MGTVRSDAFSASVDTTVRSFLCNLLVRRIVLINFCDVGPALHTWTESHSVMA